MVRHQKLIYLPFKIRLFNQLILWQHSINSLVHHLISHTNKENKMHMKKFTFGFLPKAKMVHFVTYQWTSFKTSWVKDSRIRECKQYLIINQNHSKRNSIKITMIASKTQEISCLHLISMANKVLTFKANQAVKIWSSWQLINVQKNINKKAISLTKLIEKSILSFCKGLNSSIIKRDWGNHKKIWQTNKWILISPISHNSKLSSK